MAITLCSFAISGSVRLNYRWKNDSSPSDRSYTSVVKFLDLFHYIGRLRTWLRLFPLHVLYVDH